MAWRRDRGTSLAEFAMVAILLFMTMLGAVDFGRIFWVLHIVSLGAKDGARWASLHGNESGSVATETDVQDYVRARSFGFNVTVNTTWPDGNNNPGNRVQVLVTQNVTPIVPFLRHTPLGLGSTSQMVIAH